MAASDGSASRSTTRVALVEAAQRVVGEDPLDRLRRRTEQDDRSVGWAVSVTGPPVGASGSRLGRA